MIPYKTNSADYLDYVANTLSRQQILADPDLCLLLENPYIKQNMQVAIKWNDAKYGDYKDKYDFVQYYLCNGPELDADTLLHYRKKALADPVVMEIAYSYFTNADTLSDIRQKKYGKKKTDNCFTNPCFYLGDFSPLQGSLGDYGNLQCVFNEVGLWVAQKLAITQNQKGLASKIEDKLRGNKLQPSSVEQPNGHTRFTPATQALNSSTRPQYTKGWFAMGKAIFDSQIQFTEGLLAEYAKMQGDQWQYVKWVNNDFFKCGDWFSRLCAEELNLIEKGNAWKQMGDCARMWSQVRRLKIYGSDNKYGPMTLSQRIGDTNPDGQPVTPIKNPTPIPGDATQGLKTALEIKQKQQNN